MKIRIQLFILSLFLALSSTAQINDTAVLRNYINANIIPNSTRSVTADQLNYSLTGLLNVSNRYKIDSINLKGDSLIYYVAGKRRGLKFNIPGVDSVRLSNDSLYFRRIIGGEIPIGLDYYTKSQSDNRYVLSPSGKITSSWLQAWDYCVAADVPNVADPESKYLIVNGAAGDTAFTVTGGTGMADFTPNFAAVAYSKTQNRYFTFFVVRQSGSTYHIDRSLKYDLSADTICFMWSSYQGQHMTRFGYRGYADIIYDYHKSLAAKDYKLYSFYPEDNTTIPFTSVNGAVQGGFIPSTSTPQLLQITTATINYAQVATVHYRIQQGSVADRGAEWSVNLGKKNGYLETFVGVHRGLPGYARVLFYLDGVLKRVDTVRGAARRLTYNYSGASTGKIQILTGDTQPTDIRVGRTVWYQTDLDTISKVYKGGKIMFAGDSWTQFPYLGGVFYKALTVRFTERHVADGGNASDIINVGRGGMTSEWGKYWFKYWLNLYHPKYVYIEFYINDSNSSSDYGNPAVTTWNFDSSDPYGSGLGVDGKVTQSIWLNNLKWMGDTAKAYGATPIHLMNTPTGSLTQTQGQSAWFSALRPALQYYDTEVLFSSSVVADNNVTAPVVNAITTNTDTVSTTYVRGGSTGTNSLFTLLRTVNSALNKGWIMRPATSWAGTANRFASWENNDGSDRFYWTADGISHAYGYDVYPASNYGYKIGTFQISMASGIARLTATNSTSITALRVGDSIPKVQLFAPITLSGYVTGSLPSSGDNGAMAYNTTLGKAVLNNGAGTWRVMAMETDVLARYDSNTTKNNLIRNSAAYNNLPQTADVLNLGTIRNDGTTLLNGNIRFNLGSDLKYNLYYRDSATGYLVGLPPGTYGQALKAGPGGKPEWVNVPGGTVTSVDLSLPSIFAVSGNPVTTSGTLTTSLVSQAQNLVFASPSSSSGAPTFRSLVESDIPNLDAAKITAGTLPVGRGGTGLNALGSSLQQLRVNAGGTALEYFTPPAATVGTVYNDGSLSTFPTGVDYLILRPTGNNTIELSSTATYTGNAGRVAIILNTTNFTYTIAGTTVSSKYVYVAWYANNTPSFINL